MSLDASSQELREVIGGLLRRASGDTRLRLLEMTADEWRQAASLHDLLQKTTVLQSLSDAAFDAVHDGDIDVAVLIKSVHHIVLLGEQR